jgi:hypothetical protein
VRDLDTDLIVLGLISQTVVLASAAILSHYNARKVRLAAEKVARTLAETTTMDMAALARIEQVGVQTHIIVNSQRSVMLRTLAALARRIASENPNDEAALRAADAAEKDVALDNMTQKKGVKHD